MTTSLEPYPFSTIDKLRQSGAATSSVLSAVGFTSSSSSSSPASSEEPKASRSSVIELTSSASPQPASQDHNSMMGIEVGVPMAVIVVLLASLTFSIFRKDRKQKRGLVHLQGERAEDGLPYRPEMHEHGENLVGELDVTPRYELTQSDAPRHELG